MEDLLHSAAAGESAVATERPDLSCTRTPLEAPPAPNVEPTVCQLAREIEHEVRQHTFGGVRDLEVRISEQGVVLRGRCSSFYCKQLAQHAAIRRAGARCLVNEIEVW